MEREKYIFNKKIEGEKNKEWAALEKEVKELINRVREKFFEKFDKETIFSERLFDFSEEVKAKVPDFKSYAAWHFLIDSGAPQEDTPNLDLPAPFGVVNFLNDLIRNLDRKEYIKETKEWWEEKRNESRKQKEENRKK